MLSDFAAAAVCYWCLLGDDGDNEVIWITIEAKNMRVFENSVASTIMSG